MTDSQLQNATNVDKNITKMGRPTKITRTTIAKLERILELGGTVSDACNYAGIDVSTYYRNIDKNPTFASKMVNAKLFVKINAKQNIANDIKQGNIETSKWYLENRHSDEYSKRPDIALQLNTFTVDFIEHDPDELNPND